MSVAAHSWAMVISCKARACAIFAAHLGLPMVCSQASSRTWRASVGVPLDLVRGRAAVWVGRDDVPPSDLELEGGISANQFVLKDRLNILDASLAVYWSRLVSWPLVLFRVLRMALKTRV